MSGAKVRQRTGIAADAEALLELYVIFDGEAKTGGGERAGGACRQENTHEGLRQLTRGNSRNRDRRAHRALPQIGN